MSAPPAIANTAPYASASLYVGDLSPEVTEPFLFEIFNAVGPVASVRVCRDAQTRRSLGYAYVNFHRTEDAERALDTMNFTNIRGRQCRIMWSHRDPTLRKSGAGNIFVKNLAESIDNKTLYDTFSMFGNILSCKISTNAKGESLGYGFVHYESEEAAQNAIARVNGMSIAGQKVEVAPFKSKRERGGVDKNTFTNVFVKNLPEGWTEEKLLEFFKQYGNVTSAVVASVDNKSKGFGFVNFETAEMAQRAVVVANDLEVEGKKIYVGRAQKKEERERELRDRFEQLKLERQKKYAGVNLYVKNLADNVDKDKLVALFNKFGPISSARVMTEGEKSRGFGFVCFAEPEHATKAVNEMNGKMIEGKPLYVALAQRKDVRRAQLEAQYNARAKMLAQPMYPQPPQGMFYPGAPQRMMYPQPPQGMIPRRWAGQPQNGPRGAPMMGVPMPYAMGGMPAANGRQPQAGPRGRPNQRGQQAGAPAAVPAGAVGKPKGPGGYPQGAQPPAPGRVPRPGQPQQGYGMKRPGPNAAQTPLTIQELAAAPEEQQKQIIGERLYPLIASRDPLQAAKITGMLLEMDNGELLHLMESQEALAQKIVEAQEVLRAHEVEAHDEGDVAAAGVEEAQQ